MVRQLLWYFWAIPIKILDLALTSLPLDSSSKDWNQASTAWRSFLVGGV